MTTMTETEEKYADKILKLLTLAEGDGPEAESAMVAANRLLIKYGIDEAMLDAARGLTTDELVQDQFSYSGIYRFAHQELGSIVAKNFGLRIVYGRDSYSKPITLPLYLAGFKSDVERARMLDASLQLQAVGAFKVWERSNAGELSWMDKGLKFRTRRDFFFGFGSGVASKLAETKRAARAEAAQAEAERSNVSAEEGKKSMDLVLVNRDEKVKEYYDTVWGGRTKVRNTSYKTGGADSRNSGYSAGRTANTGGTGIAGKRGAIGR